MFKNNSNLGNEIFFLSLMILAFAPHDYKLPGLGILWCCLVLAAIIDWERRKNASDASSDGSHPARKLQRRFRAP